MRWALTWSMVLLAWTGATSSQYSNCNRAPPGTQFPKAPGDNGYKIKISGNPDKYVPGEIYTVSLQGWRAQYSVQKFTGFLLVVEAGQSAGDIYDLHSVGTFQLLGDALTMHSDACPNAITQTSSTSKSEIQVLWTAPPADSGCVRFRATVVENRDVWYMDDGELTKELCEDVQETVDMQPDIISDCCACDEAKYEVTFEGLWSRHTHPKDFPTNEWLTHFSDIIGASHSADYRVWEYGGYASDGLRQVAEWGSTRELESELKRQSDHIRTIIKARGLWYPNVNGKTFAVFRVDSKHHLMSLVSMLGPTPDWIVGVSALELCLKDCSWLDQKVLNLYPWDAGTDSGVTYESENSATIPREKIRRITSSYPSDSNSPFYDPTGQLMKPFAKLTVTRQRVYEKSCSDTSLLQTEIDHAIEDTGADRRECQVSEWTAFSPCSVTCWKGLRMRTRTYLMPLKAEMMECRRQLEEKEMCAAPVTRCPGGNANLTLPILPELEVEHFDPRICATSDWSPWTACSVTCGKGHRMRNRRFLDRMGRKKCDKPLTEKQMCQGEVPECQGRPEEISPECAVTQWSEFSPCSVTCGQGFTVRTRYYLVPTTNQADCAISTMEKRPCSGERSDCTIDPSEAEEVCNQEMLPGPCRGYFPRWYFNKERQMCLPFTYGGCRGNRNKFQSYDECTRMCEFNRQSFNSQDLPDSSTENRFPTTHLHHPHSIGSTPDLEVGNAVVKVNCMVTPWSEWSSCSATCGRGHKEKRRMIKAQPQNGGRRCPKKLVRRKKCRKTKCNDGYNGLESMSLHRELPPPYKPYNPMRQVPFDPSEDYVAPSLYNPPPPMREDFESQQSAEEDAVADDGVQVDCIMGEWGPWSPCTHSCGPEALQQRSRNVIVTPRNGGVQCGDRYQRRYCTLPPCPHPRG